MRIVFVFFFISLSFLSFSQNSFSKEVSLLSDNDLYTSVYRDRYYTNGLFLTYRTVSEGQKNELVKKIHSFQIGHMIYTPIKAILEFAATHDRPFAGYFYGSNKTSRFYNSQNMLSSEIQLGVLGPQSKAQELQDFIHSIYNYPKAKGWQHQIDGAFGLNLNFEYLKYFPKMSASTFDMSSFSTLKVGTIFTNISTGIYTRIGFKKLQPISNSVAFHSNLNKTGQSSKESFLFLKPTIHYSLYDATIQGSFLNDTSPVTFDVMPFHFSLEVGYKFYKRRFHYGYNYIFHTKKLKSLSASKSNSYGSIYVGYYFN